MLLDPALFHISLQVILKFKKSTGVAESRS